MQLRQPDLTDPRDDVRANGAHYARDDQESLQWLAATVAQALTQDGAWAEN